MSLTKTSKNNVKSSDGWSFAIKERYVAEYSEPDKKITLYLEPGTGNLCNTNAGF